MNNINQNISKEEISVKELIFLIRSQVKTLIFFVLFFVFLAFTYLLVVKPVYTSSSTIIVDAENSGMASIFDLGMDSDKNHLENEIEILKSRSTSEKTIQALLDSDSRNNLLLFNTRNYADSESELRKFFLKILSFSWTEKPINTFDTSEISDSLFRSFVETLKSEIQISNSRKTDVLKVSFSSTSPGEAALIVNTIIDVYQKRDQEWASGEMSHLKEFLAEQLKFKKIELDEIENELKNFQEKEHIYGLDDNSNLLLSQLTSVESDYYASEAMRNILFERKKYFEKQLSEDEKEFTERVANTLDVQLYSIRQELSSLEAEFISTKSKQGEGHPAVIDLNKKINALKNILNKETKKYINQGINVANPIEYRQAVMDSVINLDVSISGHNSKLLELKKLVDKYEIQLSSLPKKYLEYSRFQRDRVILDETYSLMKQKLEEAKINEASQLGKIRIVDEAIANSKASSPNKKNILIINLFLGLVFGVLFILFKEYIDSTIKSLDELERRGLAILAIIPSIGSTKDVTKKKKKGYKLNLQLSQTDIIERRLLTHEDPKSPISEAYRSLRTSLMYDQVEKDSKVIMVSSPGPGEGKTTTVANLAITYANMGKKTLLIDSDLRKPVLHKMFKNDRNKGFTNFLSGHESDLKKLIYSSGLENLSILSSGAVPPNPSELLASTYMNKFLKAVKKEFDIILIDTPPLIAVTDAFVIVKHVDKFLLVVRASVTQKGALERSLVNMDNMGCNIGGVIFNGVNESNTYGGGYYYNYYQNYYGNE